MKTFLKLFFILFVGAISIELFTNNVANLTASSSHTGSPGDGQNCTACHGSIATNNNNFFIISNIPQTGYVPGTTYSVTVTLSGSGVKIFEVSPQNILGAIEGTLIAGTTTKLVNSNKDIICSSSSNASQMAWIFQWKAPIAGTGNVTFYGAGALSMNNIILTNLLVNEDVSSGINKINDKSLNVSIYPNPVNDKLNISYTLQNESKVKIELINIEGKIINTVVYEQENQGDYSKSLALNNQLNKGVYFIRIEKENSTVVKRIIIQ